MIKKPIIYNFFKGFTNRSKRTNRVVDLSCRPFPHILKYSDHRWDVSKTWKTRFLQATMFGSSGSATMFGSSDSQFFRPTTEIQLGPKNFDKSRLIITFLTNLGVTDKLCSFRLVLEGKIGQEVPNPSRLEFLEKFLANNFTLSDAENSVSNSPKVPRAKFLGRGHSFVSLAHAKLTASKTNLQQILACLNFILD